MYPENLRAIAFVADGSRAVGEVVKVQNSAVILAFGPFFGSVNI